MTRFYFIVTNLFLSFTTLYFIAPFFDFVKYFAKIDSLVIASQDFIVRFISQNVPALNELVALIFNNQFFLFQAVHLYVVFFLLDLISHLLLGVSIPAFLCGVSVEDNPISVRVNGAFRSVIGNLTFPFSVLDLPIIFNIKSVKEWITFTRLEYQSEKFKFVGLTILLPTTIILSIYAPISIHTNFANTLFTNPIDEFIIPSKKNENLSFTEKYLGLEVFSSYNADTDSFSIIPLPGETSNTLTVTLEFVENKTEEQVTLKKGTVVPLSSIQKTLEDSSIFYSLKSDSFIDTLKKSFDLNPLTVIPFFFKQDPIWWPYVTFKESIVNSIGVPFINMQITLLKGKQDIFKISDPVTSIEVTNYLLPISAISIKSNDLNSLNSYYYTVNYKASAAGFAQKIDRFLTGKTKFIYMDSSLIDSKLLNEQGVDLAETVLNEFTFSSALIDIKKIQNRLNKQEMSQTDAVLLINKISASIWKFFQEKSQSAFDQQNKTLIKVIIKSIVNTVTILEKLDNNRPIEVINRLYQIRDALETNNKSFFAK